MRSLLSLLMLIALCGCDGGSAKPNSNVPVGSAKQEFAKLLDGGIKPYDRQAIEESLARMPAVDVIAEALPQIGKAWPEGPIHNSQGNPISDSTAPPEWRVFHSIRRVWHTAANQDVETAARSMMERISTSRATFERVALVGQLQNYWIDEAELTVATVAADERLSAKQTLVAVRCLITHTGDKHFDAFRGWVPDLPNGFAEQLQTKAEFIHLLLVIRTPPKAPQRTIKTADAMMVREAFDTVERMEEEHEGFGSFLAHAVGDYLGGRFHPADDDDMIVASGDGSYYAKYTTREALRWWKMHKDEFK